MLALSNMYVRVPSIWRTRLQWGLVATLLATTPVLAEIHKWVDENGETVFSEKPPPGRETSIVKPQYGRESPEAITKLKEKTAPKPPAATDGKQASKKKEPTAAEKQANCRKARDTKTQLESSTRLRVADDKGELSYISEDERQRRIRATQESIDSWCK